MEVAKNITKAMFKKAGSLPFLRWLQSAIKIVAYHLRSWKLVSFGELPLGTGV